MLSTLFSISKLYGSHVCLKQNNRTWWSMIFACVLYMVGHKYLVFGMVLFKFLKKLYNNKKQFMNEINQKLQHILIETEI